MRTFVITLFVVSFFAFIETAQAQTPFQNCVDSGSTQLSCCLGLGGVPTQCQAIYGNGTQSQPNTTQVQSQPNTTGGNNIKLINPLKSGTSLESFLQNILAYVIRIGTIVVILMIVYVGYLFVIAQGKPGEIEKAHSALLWTVVGALILLGSQAIAISIKATVTSLGG